MSFGDGELDRNRMLRKVDELYYMMQFKGAPDAYQHYLGDNRGALMLMMLPQNLEMPVGKYVLAGVDILEPHVRHVLMDEVIAAMQIAKTSQTLDLQRQRESEIMSLLRFLAAGGMPSAAFGNQTHVYEWKRQGGFVRIQWNERKTFEAMEPSHGKPAASPPQ